MQSGSAAHLFALHLTCLFFCPTATLDGCIMGFWRVTRQSYWSTLSGPSFRFCTSSCIYATQKWRSAGFALSLCMCACVGEFSSRLKSFFCVSESGGVSDSNSGDHLALWLAVLQYVPTQGRDPAPPARLHLQRRHRQHVPVPAVLPGERKHKKPESCLRLIRIQKNACCPPGSAHTVTCTRHHELP